MKLHDTLQILPLDRLIPYARNSRTHADAQVAQIAASIREFGFTNPVLVDEAGGVIAGHGRILAARKLGMDAVPCLTLAGLTEAQRRAYVIADNKIALNAGWDEDILMGELRELGEMDLSFELGVLGFAEDELRHLLGDAAPMDEMPELPDGEKSPFQQITFTLHDSQAEQVKRAIKAAKAMGVFVDMQNENSNGNALARICETFINWTNRA